MKTWYIKKSDGTLFGPVDETKLKTWASQGRIAPDDQLSTDREQWQAAPELDSLQMDWRVHLRSGKVYGPIHVLALCDLVDDRTVSASNKLTHKADDKESTVGEALLTALLTERDAYTAAPRETSSAAEIKELRAGMALLKNELSSLKEQPRETATTGAQTVDLTEIEKRLTELAAQRDQDKAQVQEVGDMMVKVKDHLAAGKEAQQVAARATDALERVRKEKTLVEERVNNLEAAIEKIVESQANTPTTSFAPPSAELTRLREETIAKVRYIEESMQGLFRDRRAHETDVKHLSDEIDKLKRIYEDEHRLSIQRESELAELVEQLQHEKEAALIALQQARSRGSRSGYRTPAAPPREQPAATPTKEESADREGAEKRPTTKGVMVTRISRDSMR